jgi:hypothetical protein
MNYLDLCKTTHSEGGIAGAGPATAVNQTGMSAKIARWVRDAWIDLQSLYPNWKFLRKRETKTLEAGEREYGLVSDLGMPNVRKWDNDLLFITDPDTGYRAPLKFVEYPDFEATYSQFNPGKPSVFTVMPDFTLAFNATPDKAYVVTFNYWMTGERLVDDDDIPSIPEDHHMTIVWLALSRYGTHEGARNEKKDYQSEYLAALRRLEIDQLEIPHRITFRPIA